MKAMNIPTSFLNRIHKPPQFTIFRPDCSAHSFFNPAVKNKRIPFCKFQDFKPLIFHSLLVRTYPNVTINHILKILKKWKIVEDFFDRESELPLVRQAMEAHFSQKQSLYTKEQFLHKTKMFLQIFIVQLLDPLVSKTK